MRSPLLPVLLLMALATPALAHEVRPAYLELRQTGPESYEAFWKVPAVGDLRLGLYVELPSDCANVDQPRRAIADGAYTERWTVKRTGGLTGGTIRIAGLSVTMTDVLVRIERLDGTVQVDRLTPSTPSLIVEAAPRATDVARTYLTLGIEHILLGVDHLLFVLGLLLIVGRRWRVLLKTVTAFTAAHSLTLALAALGFVRVPQAPVEAVIALSIMFVALETLRLRAGRPGLTARAPWVVAFTFGLLHGFGFAGALREIGLPLGQIPVALLLFNVGVEVGQVFFVVTVITLVTALKRLRVAWPRWAEAVPSYAIGACASFWVLQRTLSF